MNDLIDEARAALASGFTVEVERNAPYYPGFSDVAVVFELRIYDVDKSARPSAVVMPCSSSIVDVATAMELVDEGAHYISRAP
jgi:hypothetical protein